jgi:acyl-CoA synthetase (NDP forming)
MVGADKAIEAVAECAAVGIPVAIVGASGFAEAGAAELQTKLLEVAGDTRILGPNCIGTVNLGTGLVASFSPFFNGEHTELKKGGIALISQSGALGFGAVSLALERGLGLGWAVTTGNEADVTALEVLTELAGEPDCTGLLGYVESLTDGVALRKLAARGKPTALLVAGRSTAGRRAAVSHTGTLAGDVRVTKAALRQLGIVEVSDVDELLDVGEAFAMAGRRSRKAGMEAAQGVGTGPDTARGLGKRVAVVTTSGGSGILAADAIEDWGLLLATLSPRTDRELRVVVPPYGSTQNPVDVTATVMRDRTLVVRCLHAVAADDGVDAILLCFCVLTGEDVDGIIAALTEVAVTKPVFVARTGAEHLAPGTTEALRALGIPSYPTPARAVRALSALVAGLGAGSEDYPGQSGQLAPKITVSDEGALKGMLAEAGITVPYGHFLDSPADFDFPGRAVFKAVVPGLVHKTEAGGVLLGVTRDMAEEAWAKIAALGGRVWAEEHIEGGVELLVGIAPSPLGRVLTISAGGILAEVLDDVAIRLLPTDPAGMLEELKINILLNGYRGKPPLDVAAFLKVVRTFTALAERWPADAVVELNPVLVREHGAVVLDAAYVEENRR